MSEYILIRDYGSEGHTAPIMSMGEKDAHEFLLTHKKHTHDVGLVIYKVPSLYDLQNDPDLKTEQMTLDHFAPKE